MRIEHVALWTHDLERLRSFYEANFGGRAGPRYDNPAHQFSSHFIDFGSGARLELMQMARVPEVAVDPRIQRTGLIHLAFDAADEAAVDALTARLESGGHRVLEVPRRTGDGYYESVVQDPDGNLLEITAPPHPTGL
jgi:lactoylglutathione lyase